MKIYRYIPNARNYSSIVRNLFGPWWPEGITLGLFMEKLYPKAYESQPWPHGGNSFEQSNPDVDLPDFPAFALNLPVISPRAADVLARAGLTFDLAPIIISGKNFFAIQPQLAELTPGMTESFVPEKSQGLVMPGGEIFFYYARAFDPSKIPGEFFTIPLFEPFSDLYITERLVSLVRENNLTGLEFIELVFDNEPVIPRYPAISPASIQQFTVRADLERDLIHGRCDLMSYTHFDIQAAIEAAIGEGYMTFEYLTPEYQLFNIDENH